MILSASRRTDLPACYPEWFMNRLREGEAVIPNPYHAGRASRLRLSPETVDCIVFWSKNPAPLEPFLPEIDSMGYPFYFEFTITAFGSELECGLPPKQEVVETFLRLSRLLGPERVDWRFDPIMVCEAYPLEWHLERFERLCRQLAGATRRCIISFADSYAHSNSRIFPMTEAKMRKAAQGLSDIAGAFSLPLFTCAETIDLSEFGVGHASCIDRDKIERLLGCEIDVKKDPGQRPACGCMASVDLGAYHTCLNGCAYCYATRSREAARKAYARHDPACPVLTGPLPDGVEIAERKIGSVRKSEASGQISLFR